MAQITKNLKLGTILKAIKIEEHAPFELGKFYKITDGDFVGSYTINNHIAYRYSINEIGDYFELIDSLEDIENLEYKASILKETLEQNKIMLGDDISDDEILKEAIEFLANDEFKGDAIELQFIYDNMDLEQVEKCSCCGKILMPDDECYSDELHDDDAVLCDHCSVFNEETDMYEKYLNQDVIEKITGLKFSSHIGNVGSKIEEFNQFIKENKFKFSILEKDEINSTTFLSFMSERTDWNTCDCCGLVEVSTDLIWDTDEVFFSNEYEKLRFLKAALVPSEAVCQSCLNLVEEIKKPSLETITSRKQENNLIFRVGEFVLLSNVEWADKPRVSNYIAKIVSLDENKKTYTLEGYGDAEFKEDEFYDVVSEAYVREFRNFIDDSYPDKSDKIYQEKITGTRKDRFSLEELLKVIRPGDKLIVYKLDRISRSTKHLIELSELFDSLNVDFISIADNIDTATAVGKFFFRTMASIAELERDIISERTKIGLQAARARGRIGGRPSKKTDKVLMSIKMYKSKDYTINQITDATGVSKTTLYRYLNNPKFHGWKIDG